MTTLTPADVRLVRIDRDSPFGPRYRVEDAAGRVLGEVAQHEEESWRYNESGTVRVGYRGKSRHWEYRLPGDVVERGFAYLRRDTVNDLLRALAEQENQT